MPNDFFQFRQFRVDQGHCGMKVTTEACLFGSLIPLQGSERIILDIGTGTGLLSLMLAQRTAARIDAVEKDEKAFHQAKQNFFNSPWSDRLSIAESSIQDFSVSKAPHYDLIVCNPPFFSDHLKNETKYGNQAIHSDSLPQSDLIHSINSLATASAVVWLLYPPFEFRQFQIAMAKDHWHVQSQIRIYNRRGKPLFRIVGSFAKKESKKIESDFFIRTEGNSYSKEFTNLLTPYYL